MPTKHHIEQEIKLTAPDSATLEELFDAPLVQQFALSHASASPARRFIATYYDCPNWTLRSKRWSLRTRYEGEKHVCTLKHNSIIHEGFSSCEELEQTITREITRVACIPRGTIADTLLEVIPASTTLLPRVKVDMQRRTRELAFGDTRLELVSDAGVISANGQQLDLFEVELELLQGDIHAPEVQAFVETLCRHYSLQPSQVSKHQLGLGCYPGQG